MGRQGAKGGAKSPPTAPPRARNGKEMKHSSLRHTRDRAGPVETDLFSVSLTLRYEIM